MDMNEKIANALQEWLPDEKVFADLRAVFTSLGGEPIEVNPHGIEDNNPDNKPSLSISVPHDCQLEIVGKSMLEQRYEFGIGTYFRAVVAVGGVDRVESGFLEPKLLVATVWYSPEGELIKTKYSEYF